MTVLLDFKVRYIPVERGDAPHGVDRLTRDFGYELEATAWRGTSLDENSYGMATCRLIIRSRTILSSFGYESG